MKLKRISLKNWKNFRLVAAEISDLTFIVGANASGKSNFLDAICFMRDIVKHGGGLQYAVSKRGGVSKIRCLSTRKKSDIEICMEFLEDNTIWKYTLIIGQQPRGDRNTIVLKESLHHGDAVIISRPDINDERDGERLTQTYIEQIATNKDFRNIVKYLESAKYTHIVPQFLKFPDAFPASDSADDPFGKGFLKSILKTPDDIRKRRLEKIQIVLRQAIPQLEKLSYIEEAGQPHLEVSYKHWKQNGKQRESQLSDGTLRLIGLVWALLDGQGLLLLEEPEVSLNSAIVEKLPELLYSVQRTKKRQIILTTHSADLLDGKNVSMSNIIVLKSENGGTIIENLNVNKGIKEDVANGKSLSDAVIPLTKPDLSKGLLPEKTIAEKIIDEPHRNPAGAAKALQNDKKIPKPFFKLSSIRAKKNAGR
ncbi:MAG: ATP-binding protein [Termitinemataceae bacterium]|nr:MAG: ATP-binding protein [Termitinemataceae bacterium]